MKKMLIQILGAKGHIWYNKRFVIVVFIKGALHCTVVTMINLGSRSLGIVQRACSSLNILVFIEQFSL